MTTKRLYKREDARRMAATMLKIRSEQGEQLPVPKGTRRMKALPANVLANYASRPACARTLILVSATNDVVTFRVGGAR